ncbi:MAG: hypothetical protein AB8H80_06470 [Planctomycetota bacterium]
MMETGTRLACAATFLTLTAPSQTPPIEYEGVLQGPEKNVTLPKPKGWEFDEARITAPARKRGVTTEMLSTRAETMAYGEVFISVFWLPGASLTPRLQAINERLDHARRNPTKASERTLDLEPIVHATYPAVHEEGFTKAKPLTIYVNGDSNARAKLLHQDDEVDVLRDTGMARMVARAVHADHKADRALFASQLHKALVESILPRSEKWLLRGEAHLVWGETYTGRKLPYVRNQSLYAVSRLQLDLAECRKRALQDFDSSVTESCAGWRAYFRLAPGKHKKAWKAYLANLRTTVDGDTAFEQLIASLDSKDLHREARKVLSKKLKPAEK